MSLHALDPAEIVVLDSGSDDDTCSIAKAHGAQVIETDWAGHVAQKNRALAACGRPWVLSLDADEPISNELAANIRSLFAAGEPSNNGYEISRLTWYLGDWLRHVWYPEWRLRLVRRGKARWVGEDPHDRLEVDGSVGRLQGDILHYSYENVEDHFRRSIDYARIGAQSLATSGKPFRWHKLVLAPLVRFFRLLIIRQGWRDGWRGWIIAWSSMFSGFLKYAFLYERERNQRGAGRD
jgi:glycosyltransferase involved in cell wall biosynthesis